MKLAMPIIHISSRACTVAGNCAFRHAQLSVQGINGQRGSCDFASTAKSAAAVELCSIMGL
ncbi:MAG: hypothetical protein JSR14_00810 [Proteobacteria bacterium]|nr:hypothetical protein [Pseudomonadota bacterium]